MSEMIELSRMMRNIKVDECRMCNKMRMCMLTYKVWEVEWCSGNEDEIRR